jgi:diguanylate cyclase (GGDEF)-like protein
VNRNNKNSKRHPDIPIFVADASDKSTDWLVKALRDSGLQDTTQLAAIEELSLYTRELIFQEHGVPFLAVITTDKIDNALINRCQRFLRLGEKGWLGMVIAVQEEETDNISSINALQQGFFDVIHLEQQSAINQELLQRLRLTMELLMERRIRLRQERTFNIRIAENRVVEARLHYLAQHDELTDLANRDAFAKALNEAIRLGADKQISHALLYLDLDRFKLHNEAAGHNRGNALLQTVANRLRSVLPQEYLLARLGSDEFAVLLQAVDEAEAANEAELLRTTIANIEPDGDAIIYHVGISIGIAMIYPGTEDNASQVLARAEQACFVAKTRGGNTMHRFSQEDEILQNMREDMHWAQPIRLALGDNQLFLTFQPVLDVKKQSINHFEALVRIPSSLGGDENSARFMLAAERLGLAQQIDLWVISNAIDFLTDNSDISLGVNLSSYAFQEGAMLALLEEKLQSSLIEPQRLTFEITETSAILSFADTRRMVTTLRDLGCRFALDDFGSGFSTYHYLKQFPIDILKIDGSFILNLKNDQQDKTIVQSMIDIAHGLGKEVVAEFIEDNETLGMLINMGVDHAQGYYIGKPTRSPMSCQQWQDREKKQ